MYRCQKEKNAREKREKKERGLSLEQYAMLQTQKSSFINVINRIEGCHRVAIIDEVYKLFNAGNTVDDIKEKIDALYQGAERDEFYDFLAAYEQTLKVLSR